jgi:flagellar hook-associated protein 2
MAIESIAKTLGSGSGIDISALVGQLVDAQFANKNDALTRKTETLTAQISALGEIKSAVSSFSSALSALASSGSLATQPTSSNGSILSIAALPGAKLAGTSAQIEVRQLAQAQVASTDPFASGETTAVPTGTLTLTFGKAAVADGDMTGFTPGPGTPVAITIGSADATLAGVARAINAANAGVTASILNDGSGARLVIKGATGGSQAFTLQGGAGLEALDVGVGAGGSTVASAAQDSIVAVDGVETNRMTNTIWGLVEGTRIDLVSAAIGTKVTIGTRAPTEAITQSVTNFAETYNEVFAMVKAAIDPVTGPLRRDPAAKDLMRQLKSITVTPLFANPVTGKPATLADIGIGTERVGTLKVDSARVAEALTNYPREVEAMFAPGAGIAKALASIATRATDRTTGLGASETSYAKAQTDVAEDRVEALADAERVRARMTRQFASMDAIVSTYKTTQTFLEQQVDAWNGNN